MAVLAAAFTSWHVSVLTGLLGYGACCGLAALALPLRYAALTGVTGWAFLTGFVVNADGSLTFARGDLEHLAMLLVLSAALSVARSSRTAHAESAKESAEVSPGRR